VGVQNILQPEVRKGVLRAETNNSEKEGSRRESKTKTHIAD
jgi:hypothetical protein